MNDEVKPLTDEQYSRVVDHHAGKRHAILIDTETGEQFVYENLFATITAKNEEIERLKAEVKEKNRFIDGLRARTK